MQQSEMYASNSSAPRSAQIEALLADYPKLSPTEVDDLISWFEHEASAYDVAMMASDEAIKTGYTQFRADHIDRLTGKDFVRASMFLALVVSCILGIIWLAP